MVDSFTAVMTVISSFSVLGSAFIIFTILYSKTMRESSTLRNLFWMSIADLVLAIRELLGLHEMLDVTKPFLCVLDGVTGVFSETATTSWYFCISVTVFLSLTGRNLSNWRRFYLLQHCAVWGVSAVSALLPWALDQYHPEHGSTECYMTNPRAGSRIFIVALWTIYVLFSVVLICSMFKSNLLPANSKTRRDILSRLMMFSVVFAVSWGIVVLYDWWVIITNRDPPPPDWLSDLALGLVYASGFNNCLLWLSTPSFRREIRRWTRGDKVATQADPNLPPDTWENSVSDDLYHAESQIESQIHFIHHQDEH